MFYRKNNLTAGRQRLAEIRTWRECAIADGWSIAPTYKTESIERAAKLTHPNGFTAGILARDDSEPPGHPHLGTDIRSDEE